MFLRFVVFKIAYLRGKRYETEKKIWGGQSGNKNAEKRSVQIDTSEKTPTTRDLLAKEYGGCG